MRFKTMAKTLRLILGDQLNSKHSWYEKVDGDVTYVLMEVMQEQEYVMHHAQKILAFFAAMRNFAHQLQKAGHQVVYLGLDDKDNRQSFEDNLIHLINEHQVTRFEYQLPDEYRLDEQLKNFCSKINTEHGVADTEHFLTTRYEVRDFFGNKKSYLMESFYRAMRKRLNILVDGEDPVGGQWNYDHDNRKKYDGKVPLKDAITFKHDVSALKKMIDVKGVKYFGSVDKKNFGWPLTRKEALTALNFFCEELLPHFGTYEDAMLNEHISLFHSRISFAQNVKMVSPQEIVSAVLAAWNKNKKNISLAQVEGFIRQVIGWREFMRGVYWAKMPGFQELNFFKNKNKLPKWFWDGKTKMNCLNKCIGQSLDHAWAHHIQRLMVIGNFALLNGSKPNEVDEWYLGVYIDALQWVEITNTRGMSQFADGGIIGSKPYVASATYINKMSDYCKHCSYDPKKRHGENACPFNSLYWNFFDRNRAQLENNPRIGFAYKTWDKMAPDEKEKTLRQAHQYIKNVDAL